jgi:hypothetical protein
MRCFDTPLRILLACTLMLNVQRTKNNNGQEKPEKRKERVKINIEVIRNRQATGNPVWLTAL